VSELIKKIYENVSDDEDEDMEDSDMEGSDIGYDGEEGYVDAEEELVEDAEKFSADDVEEAMKDAEKPVEEDAGDTINVKSELELEL